MIGVLGQAASGSNVDEMKAQYGLPVGAGTVLSPAVSTFGVNPADPNTWRVWRGGSPSNPRQADQGTPEAMADPANREAALQADFDRITADPGEMLQSFYNLSDEEMDQLRQVAASLGEEIDYVSLRSVWSDLVSLATEMYSLGGKNISVWEAGQMLVEDAELAGDDDDAYDGPVTSTTSTTNFTDPVSAYSFVADFVDSQLGRTPTEREVRAFTDALRAYEAANPSVSTTTTSPGDPNDPSMGTNQSIVTEGGAADPGNFVDGWAQAEFGKELDLRYANDVGGDIISALISGSL